MNRQKKMLKHIKPDGRGVEIGPSHRPIAEYFLNVVSKNGHIAWGADTEGECLQMHTLENARQAMDTVRQDNTCLDVHAWCFLPHSFRLMIHDLFNPGLIPFREVDFYPSEGFEFHIKRLAGRLVR